MYIRNCLKSRCKIYLKTGSSAKIYWWRLQNLLNRSCPLGGHLVGLGIHLTKYLTKFCDSLPDCLTLRPQHIPICLGLQLVFRPKFVYFIQTRDFREFLKDELSYCAILQSLVQSMPMSNVK